MKKQTTIMAVLSAAAIMSAAAPQINNFMGYAGTVYAQSTGWVEEDGLWSYYDNDGFLVTDAWKKSGTDWYYLNSDGIRESSMMIDEEFYVDQDGKMVTNSWVAIDNEDSWDSPDTVEKYWYYFGKDGKAIKSKLQKINDSWYYFNEDGQMQTGIVELDGETYYFGDSADGTMKTGWIQLEDHDGSPDSDHSWYYFDNNGRMVKNQIDRKIGEHYYTFEDGRMQTGWYNTNVTTAETATASEAAAANTVNGYQYYDEADGKRVNGWQTINGVDGLSAEDTLYKFYFKNGKPYHATTGVQVFTVESQKYAFNTRGEMQSGLQVVTLADGNVANFYFGNDGIMKTGKQTIYSEDLGQNQNWFFYTDGTRKGQGFHGVRDNNVYIYGLRQDADADLRYAPASFGDKEYLVNTSGTIQKASSSSKSSIKPELGNGFKDIKDANNTTWVVDTNGIIQK